MAAFPGGLPVFTGFTSSHTLAADNHASQHNLEQAEIVQIATKIGTGSSTPASSLVLRGTGAGTSAWGPVALTTDVTGTLPVANGGTGQNNLTSLPLASPAISGTVSGGATYTSPTLTTPILTTPTIASFVNAVHNHQNNAGGGQLDFGALLSTIFSGQLLSQTNGGAAGGTIYYINLGGIKIAFGDTAQSGNIVTGATGNFAINWPTSFFSSAPYVCLGTESDNTGSSLNVTCFRLATPTTSGVTFGLNNQSGSTITAKISYLAIGV